MNLVDNLSDLGESYDNTLKEMTDGRKSFTDIRIVSEHLADMATVLGNAAFALGEHLGDHINEVTRKHVTAQEVQDAKIHLKHVQDMMETVETLSRRAADLLGEAS